MKELQPRPRDLKFHEEMYCRKHTRGKCLNLQKPLRDFGMQTEEAIARRISGELKIASEKAIKKSLFQTQLISVNFLTIAYHYYCHALVLHLNYVQQEIPILTVNILRYAHHIFFQV